MAESISATECAGEKMLVEESSQKNGSVLNEEGFTLEFDPRPQRALRLNRRGLFILNRDEDKESSKTSPGAVNPCKQNDCNKPEVSHNRLKSPPTSEQKIIKLTSKMSQNCLKRSSSEITSNGTDQGSSAKKKHKPITWP